MRERRLEVNGVAGLIAEWGAADSSEAIVCLHGVPGSGRDFQQLAPALSELGRCVAIDLPGFGRADKPVDFPYSIEGYQTWLDPAIRELGIERAHLVLHDFGGPIGLLWAAMHPPQFASATLLATGVLPGYRWHLLGRLWRIPRLGELIQRSTSRPLFKLWMRRGNRRGLDSAWLDQLIDEDDAATRRATLALYRATDEPGSALLAQALAPQAKPALVIWGQNDPYVGPEYAAAQRRVFPNARIEVWPNTGHWPHIQHPAANSGGDLYVSEGSEPRFQLIRCCRFLRLSRVGRRRHCTQDGHEHDRRSVVRWTSPCNVPSSASNR